MKPGFAVLAIACGVVVAGVASGTELAEKTLLVVFHDNEAIEIPDGGGQYPPTDAVISSASVVSELEALGAESISRAFPEASATDTLATARTGEVVRLTDFSVFHRLVFPTVSSAEQALLALSSSPNFDMVEMDGLTGEDGGVTYPRDERFVTGEQWSLWNTGQSGGASDADIDAPQAWGLSQGSQNVIIAIVDTGIDRNHEDLAGRIIGDTTSPNTDHGTAVAGIVGAIADNGKGIVGVDWNAHILNAQKPDAVASADENLAGVIRKAVVTVGAQIMNCSWHLEPLGRFSSTVRAAFADAYKMNSVATVTMGNTGTEFTQFPAGYHGVVAIGSTDASDVIAATSTSGPHIDVVAPGVAILSTKWGGGYQLFSGTSFAAPHVAGTAGLLLGQNPSLYNDDIEQIIRLSADDLGAAGFDNTYGMGRVNARRALELARAPNTIVHSTIVGGTVTNVSGWHNTQFYGVSGLKDGHTYKVRVHEVRRTVVVLPPYPDSIHIWGRGVATAGFTTEEPNHGMGWCGLVSPLNNPVGTFAVRTYIYEVVATFLGVDWPLGFFPTDASHVAMAITTLTVNTNREPDAQMSYFVPEAGDLGAPAVGVDAVRFFRTCPNNDGGTSLPNHARIRIVVRDAQGMPVSGVPAEQIYVAFNRGTPGQSFVGSGADSVIASGVYNDAPVCPEVFALTADAPTNSAGTAYISFAGHAPSDAPGISSRDPARKWGHYDSDLPVYVRGIRVTGRLLEADPPGTYVLRIKNYDYASGLGVAMNQGEMVTSSDFNGVYNGINVNNAISYWKDFDSSGAVTGTDANLVLYHVGHDCDTPNDP